MWRGSLITEDTTIANRESSTVHRDRLTRRRSNINAQITNRIKTPRTRLENTHALAQAQAQAASSSHAFESQLR